MATVMLCIIWNEAFIPIPSTKLQMRKFTATVSCLVSRHVTRDSDQCKAQDGKARTAPDASKLADIPFRHLKDDSEKEKNAKKITDITIRLSSSLAANFSHQEAFLDTSIILRPYSRELAAIELTHVL